MPSSLASTLESCSKVFCHNEIQTQADAVPAQLTGQIFQVFVCSQSRVYGVKILHCIAAVIVGVRHLQQGHQVQIRQFLLFQVRQLLCQTFQVPGKEIRVHGHAEHIAALVPRGVGDAGLVQRLQFGAAGGSCLFHLGFQSMQRSSILIQFHEQPF